MYRYHVKTYSLRAQANIYYSNTTSDNDFETITPVMLNSSSTTKQTVKNLQVQLRIGVQKNIEFDKWGFSYGMDGVFDGSNYEVSNEILNPNSYGSSRNVSNQSSNSSGYGVAPLLGFYYKVNSRLIVSVENSFTFLYTQHSARYKTEYFFTPVNGTEGLNATTNSSTNSTTSELNFGPSKYLRLFIGFKF